MGELGESVQGQGQAVCQPGNHEPLERQATTNDSNAAGREPGTRGCGGRWGVWRRVDVIQKGTNHGAPCRAGSWHLLWGSMGL